LLATAAALHRARPDAEITALGTARGIETRVVPAAGYRLELVEPVPLPRRPSVELLAVPGRLGSAVRQTLTVLDRVRPDVVVGFGGYVAVPATIAARRRSIPLVVHEGNALPGIANRFAALCCTKHVATSYPGTVLRHGHYVGLPIRRSIAELDRAAARSIARTTFGLDLDRPTLLVTGGSQGAQRLNTSVAAAAAELAAAGVQVLHVCGPGQQVVPERPADSPPYVVVPFVDRMELAYAAADLVVCRAGSNTVTETAAVGLPAVFVPLPIGNGEQQHNARAVVDAGGALLVHDAAFTPDWVRAVVPALVADQERLAAMSESGSGLVRRDADRRLAQLVLEVAAGPR
jgi:UDP-N-acetylglucosamine--N-acetylmuramyl-(pentapeptide) pyrophosphoryl-undecaprenol N-acetylglucosamine transferase